MEPKHPRNNVCSSTAETVKEVVIGDPELQPHINTQAIPTMPPNQPTVKGIAQSSEIPYRASIGFLAAGEKKLLR